MFVLNNPVKTEDLSGYRVTSNLCVGCNESITILITPQQLYAYNQGGYAQDVLPELTNEQRERFISGICGICWITLFTDEEL
jgi:hypothetical protein